MPLYGKAKKLCVYAGKGFLKIFPGGYLSGI
jgi:hypothetical protein